MVVDKLISLQGEDTYGLSTYQPVNLSTSQKFQAETN